MGGTNFVKEISVDVVFAKQSGQYYLLSACLHSRSAESGKILISSGMAAQFFCVCSWNDRFLSKCH